MQRWLRLTVFSLFAALVAGPSFAQGLEKPKLTIGVGGKPLIYYLPLTIAERNGYFKAEGLDVEILDFPGGAKALQALLGGSVDIVSGAYEHTISQQAKGQAIEALVLQGRYSGIVLAMTKAKAAIQGKVGDGLKQLRYRFAVQPQRQVGIWGERRLKRCQLFVQLCDLLI